MHDDASVTLVVKATEPGWTNRWVRSASQTTTDFPIDRTAWFAAARYGLFLHWGLYSLLGRGEWVMDREAIPLKEYVTLADRFTAEHYDPRQWARLAVDAGMRYVVLTAKHHEGFCLWDSKACRFNAPRSAARRDLLAEYVQAIRDAGLKVGLYYSLGDWYNQDWFAGWQGDAAARERFMDYTHALVRELMTGYGKIDVLWYDLPQNYSAAEWRMIELNAMVRQLQPHILINNRGMTTEDFATSERQITASAPGRLWEANLPLNDNWGYCRGDVDYKSPKQVVDMLVSVASRCGNLLLNVGPDGSGRIDDTSQRILRRAGQWLRTHGECIYRANSRYTECNLFRCTVQDHLLYLHLNHYSGDPEIIIGGLQNRVLGATLLTTRQRLEVRQRSRQTFVGPLPRNSPDELGPVIRLELDGPPRQDFTQVIGAANAMPHFP